MTSTHPSNWKCGPCDGMQFFWPSASTPTSASASSTLERKETAIFHLFPQLPTELRIKIWKATSESRILVIIICENHFWSPNPVPAVLQACRESRSFSSYRKAFTTPAEPVSRYIWADFDLDTVQACSSLVGHKNNREISSIRYFRAEPNWALLEFDHIPARWTKELVSFFQGLKALDILVHKIGAWTEFFEANLNWPESCPKPDIRIINHNNGEYITEVNSQPYSDWLDINVRGASSIIRSVPDLDKKSDEERMEAMRLYGHPLPVADLRKGIV
ncbi:hypothetical protein EsH8_IV_001302 [Colletotrichum jinshuiense]